MTSSEQMMERIISLAEELAKESGEVDESMGVCWLDAVENYAIEIGDAVAAKLIEKKSADRPVVEDEPACPQCGKQGRYQGLRAREMLSRRGPVTITEPAYYCPCCRKAFFPDDPPEWR